MNTPVYVPNAGIVLLNSFLKLLFERLELVENDQFISTKAQIDAVNYLQFLATGDTIVADEFLALNKSLCGLPWSTIVPTSTIVGSKEKSLINGLIKAAIGHWSEIGGSSIEGFRGNWLVREGQLSSTEEHLELVVAQRPYDILINQSPFSFSVIKHPWMDSVLRVKWSY